MSEKRPPASGKTSALLGDLESIRSLLTDSQETTRAAEQEPGRQDASDDEVPLLEDVVQGGVSVNEAFLAGEGDFDESGSSTGLDDDVFKALLSNEWRETSRDGVPARDGMAADAWTQTIADDALDATIMACIDEALQRWLREAVLRGIEDLRHQLLMEVRQALAGTTAAPPGEKSPGSGSSPDEETDGA